MRTNDLAIKLAVIKMVKDAAAAAETDAKYHLEQAMDPGDRKHARLPDGTDAGTVSFSTKSAKAVVTDRAAFTAWATDAAPPEVRVQVTLDADDVLGALLYQQGIKERREHYARVTAAIEAAEPQVTEAFEKRVLAEVVKAGAPINPETGEVIPGVEYRPGGDAGYVSVRQTEAQRDALHAAWAAGGLDLLGLATTPVAELEATTTP
jgi:hypothetical protein